MGVIHLKTLLEELAAAGIDTYEGMAEYVRAMRIKLGMKPGEKFIIAIDASLYMIRYKRNSEKIERLFLRQLLLALEAGAVPLYVFDGIAPQQKRPIIRDRQQKKQRVRSRLEHMANNSFAKGARTYAQGNESPKSTKSPKHEETYDPSSLIRDLSSFSVDSLIQHIDRTMCETLGKPCGSVGSIRHNPSTQQHTDYDEFVRLAKRMASISNTDTDRLKKFFDILRIPYITAPGEADDMMVSLWKQGLVHALQTEDSDMFVKRCGNVIHVSNKGIKHFCLPRMLVSLGLTYEQFVDLCVLLGSDYYKAYLPRMKWLELYSLFIRLEDPCIEEFVLAYATIDDSIIHHLEAYQEARRLFITPIPITVTRININLRPIALNTITDYFTSVGIELNKREVQSMRSTLGRVNRFIRG
ncbi:FLAP endonuclease [uncultured virus]|nr:FLAP endonuclease [uncultured virus]